MTIEEMKERKQELGYSYQDIAALANLPLSTVQKILGGITSSPRRETILKLEAVLRNPDVYKAQMVCEPTNSYGSSLASELPPKKQGEYTLDDYYALPDDQRMELIDGVLYEMTAPSSPHQLIGGSIHSQLLEYRRKKKGPCIPMIAPVDVQLDCDDKTMVQPDVLIVCDRSKIIRRCVYGAPDFVVEVLSPSTRKKDMFKKMQKYTDAGVREYWLVDPDKRKVIVYDLENMEIPSIYPFTSPIPVKIWNNECLVDFTDVSEMLDDLFPSE